MNNSENTKSVIPEKMAGLHSDEFSADEPPISRFPIRLVILVVISVFFCETLVMFAISPLMASSRVFTAILDSAILIILLTPLLYFFMLRPLVYHINKRKEAEKALHESRQELEKRVENRTAQLVSLNEQLKLEIAARKLHEKKLSDHQKKLLSLSSELVLTEERERRRIANGLHGGIGQTLALAKFKLDELMEMSPSKKIAMPIDQIRGFIEQTIEHTRSLTFELSPPVLYQVGLEAALAWLVNDTREKHGIRIAFNDDAQAKPLDDNCRVIIFQATRELLFNVVKHAKARSAKVSIRKEGDAVRIDIEDDGIGFDTSEISSSEANSKSFGLFSIRERLSPLNGRLEIESEPGSGTHVTVALPLTCTITNTGK